MNSVYLFHQKRVVIKKKIGFPNDLPSAWWKIHCLQITIAAPEGESKGYPYIKISFQVTHTANERLTTPLGPTFPILFEQCREVLLYYYHFFCILQGQISESAVRCGLLFFVLI